MASFEVVASAPRSEEAIEAWCMEVARVECLQRGIAVPSVRFRYSKSAPARLRKSPVSIAWGRQLLEKHPSRILVVPGNNPHPNPALTTERYYWLTPYRAREAYELSSGRTRYRPSYSAGISVTFGTDEEDRKLVFLHELAHWFDDGKDGYDHHNERFWRRAFNLYDKYGLDREVYLLREEQYRKAAGRVAAKTGRK